MPKKTKQTAARSFPFRLRPIGDVDLIPDDKAVELARELGFAAELPRSDKDRALLWTSIGMELAKERIGRRERGRPLVWDQNKYADLILDLFKVHKDWSNPPSAMIFARRLTNRLPEKYGSYAKPNTKLKNFSEKTVLPMKRLATQLVKIASGK
jgi:hypothetical protein